MAANSVDSDQYVDGSIDTAHIGNLQVTTAKIAADAIDGTKLADNAVNSEHYTDGSIDRVHLAADIVDGTKIADDSINSEHYVDGSIDTAHIANDAVTGDKLANNIQIAGTLGVTGETTLSTHLNMGDNDIIKLGDGADLQIYHNGTSGASYISEQGSGNFIILGTNFRINNAADTQNMITADDNSFVKLFYAGSGKLETTNTGVDVTGNITVSGTVDGRDVASDGTKLDGIESSATADQTASEILTLIKTVDGAGSGLDADTLDGVSSASFLRSDAVDIATQRIQYQANLTNNWDTIATATSSLGGIEIYNSGATNDAFMAFHTGADFGFYFGLDAGIDDIAVGGWSFGANSYRIWHQGNDGSGSGLDSDTVDGVQASQFLRSDAEDTKTAGALNFNDNVLARFGTGNDLQIYHDSANSYIIDQGTGQLRIRASNLQLQDSSGYTYIEGVDTGTGGTVTLYHNAVAKLNTTSSGINVDGNINAVDNIYVASALYHEGDTDTYTQFHAANQWRVVTGGTEMLEVNDSYVVLGANSAGNVQTTSVSGGATPNLHVYNSFMWTLTGNLTLNNPTTEVKGMSGVFIFVQDGTGSRTVSLGTDWETAGGAGLTLSTAANAVDIVPYYVQGNGNILLGTPQLAFS
jgi:hypothetical protein